MLDILIVSTPDGFFAQDHMPWSSMDVNKIKEYIEYEGFVVKLVDYNYLILNIERIKNKIIIYTSSQRSEHKSYIEDIMYYLNGDNKLIPSFESLKSHENKGFQTLMSKKYGLNLLDSKYYCDSKDIDSELIFPLVYKDVDGASSRGVSIVNDFEMIERKSFDFMKLDLNFVKKNLKKYIFKKRYNASWERYLEYGRKRFVLQRFVESLEFDFKVLIFGDKFFVLKRHVASGDFRASGSGMHTSEVDDKELFLVLDEANRFKDKYKSHIYSLDICIENGNPFIIEFQFTHVGPITLTQSNFYHKKIDGKWIKINGESDLELDFSKAIVSYIR